MTKTQAKVKVKLGDRPESFPPITVDFISNKGLPSDIVAVFKYRTRKEFGAFVSESFSVDSKEFPIKEDGGIDFEELASKNTSNDAAYLKGAMVSWDFDDELSLKSLGQLADEQPAAIVALKQAYAEACNSGNLGN